MTKACSFQSFTFVWFMTFCGNAWETWSTSLMFHWCYSFIFFQFLPYYAWSTGNPAVQCFSSPPLFWGKDVDGDSNLGCECGNGNSRSWPVFINTVCREGPQSGRKEILQLWFHPNSTLAYHGWEMPKMQLLLWTYSYSTLCRFSLC